MADDVGGTNESPKGGHFFALYHCSRVKPDQERKENTTEECVLTLKTSDLPTTCEAEVQKLLIQRLTKYLVYPLQGSVLSADVGLSGDAGKKSACYYCSSLYQQQGAGDQDNSHFVVCFISDKEDTLDQFRLDLDQYSKDIFKQLQSSQEVSAAVQVSLETWHTVAIEYLSRCVSALKENLKYLVHAALLDKKLVTSGGTAELQTDIQKFYSACGLSEILSQLKETRLRQDAGSLSGSVDMLVDASSGTVAEEGPNIVTVSISAESIKLDTSCCNRFCEEWGNVLNRPDMEGPAKLRHIIEAFKLKFIQTMNTLKRLLREAENDFYALYRAYVFLRSSGNCEILMHYVTEEGLPETASVLKVLQDFITETEVTEISS